MGGDVFDEEYPLEDLEIPTSDFMAKVPVGDFRKSWENMGNGNEVLEKFSLQFKKLEDAVTAVIDFLGMSPCDGTGSIKANAGGKPHMLHLSGVFVGGTLFLQERKLLWMQVVWELYLRLLSGVKIKPLVGLLLTVFGRFGYFYLLRCSFTFWNYLR